MINTILILGITTIIINIPFGYWREGVRKFSINWFIAVHAAVPIIITLRIMTGIEWRVATIAFLVICYFLGQFFGARLKLRLKPVELREEGVTDK